MKKAFFVLTIFSVLFLLAVIIPAGFLMNECIYSWIHGTVHGFNGDEILYGFSAFLDTFMFFLSFILFVGLLADYSGFIDCSFGYYKKTVR